jgi:hypothetical protein
MSRSSLVAVSGHKAEVNDLATICVLCTRVVGRRIMVLPVYGTKT